MASTQATALPADGAPAEARYSIRVTSRLTSIELDTLRMWERRYGFPRPERTSGGSRVYSASEVEALKLIRLALDQGYRPGEVVGKSSEDLAKLVLTTSRAATRVISGTPTVATLLATLGRDDVVALRAELRRAAVVLGPMGFVVDVAHPMSVRVGELWADGKLEVRHEHMVTECLSAQLRVLMGAYEDHASAPRVLLATLPNERHGLGLEMVQVYLAVRQITAVMLGVDTPAEQIVKATHGHGADAVGLLVTHASDLKVTKKHLRWMLGELPRRVAIWIGGAAARDIELRAHDGALRRITSWSELDDAIATIVTSSA